MDRTTRKGQGLFCLMIAVIAGLLAIAASPRAAHASAIVTYAGPGTGGLRTDGPYSLYTKFTVGTQDATVTALGVQGVTAAAVADGSIPAGVSVPVGIWSLSGSTVTLLQQTTVSSTDTTVINGYRYHALGSSILLTHGQQYIVGALVGRDVGGVGTPVNFLDASSGFANKMMTMFTATPDSGVALDGYTFKAGASLVAPGTSFTAGGSGFRWGAANALITIPEPAALGLLGLSGLIVLSCRRRQRRTGGFR